MEDVDQYFQIWTPQGEKISVATAYTLGEHIEYYDPTGIGDITSPYWVAEMLESLVKDGAIERWRQLKPLPALATVDDEGVY